MLDDSAGKHRVKFGGRGEPASLAEATRPSYKAFRHRRHRVPPADLLRPASTTCAAD